MTPPPHSVPLLRPRLPDGAALAPYLAEIDASRWYSNFGALERRLRARLAEHFGLPEGVVVCVANGTLGLTLALLALEPSRGALCMMPSWTFVATPLAANAAGLTPWFVDVSPESWSLEPDGARQALAQAPGPVGAVIAVGPFGSAPNPDDWDRFTEETGIPVVLDLASCFDSARPGRSPAMVSLHATKVLSTGEGGLVCSTDPDFVERVRLLSVFGLTARGSEARGLNGKMSEYAAAVGLAALDAWPETRRCLAALTTQYVAALEHLSGVRLSPGFGRGSVSGSCNVEILTATAESVDAAMAEAGIETRRWWARGCHRHPAFADCPRTALPVTEGLAERVLGLPFYVDLDAVDQVCGALREALEQA